MAAMAKKSPPAFLSTHPTNETRIENLISEWQVALPIYNQAKEDGKIPECEKNW
jgi:predicted Zn-dependent protease